MHPRSDDPTGELPRVPPTPDYPTPDYRTPDYPTPDYRTPDYEWTLDQRVPRSYRGRRSPDGPAGYGAPTVYSAPSHSYRPPTQWWRRRGALAAGGAFAAVLLLATGGWAMLRPDGGQPVGLVAAPSSSASESPSATAAPTTDPPTPTPTKAQPAPQPVVTHNPVPVAPPPTHPPVQERPPPPQPAPTPSAGCVPTYNGTNAPKTDVRNALVSAGGTQYWVGVVLPKDYQGPLVPITVPANLMKAIAWQESGWQSAIVACDGGIGTMQLMPGTVQQIQARFGVDFDVNTLSGNTQLGANYLEWLIMYFGLYYYGQNFDLALQAPVGPGGEKLALLDVVIAAYNVGPSGLEATDGSNTLSIPNQQYVDNVRALMTNCTCLSI